MLVSSIVLGADATDDASHAMYISILGWKRS
jgi:hypothetical protein